ncbi:MAG: 4Fe-4S dicluster domain-containing protein [Bacteroidales bacterium]|nr:4Fe-4S dicluster domain-containing protein [Bacteroidales bacterium]
MGKLFKSLKEDVRFTHGLNSCINCGTCTAICPAASFFDYDPREITDQLQCEDENILEELLKGDKIWFCGQCMSCKTRCPRNNTPGLIIMALRNLSIETGFYMYSSRGRQMYALKKLIGDTILAKGYCVHADGLDTCLFPELGPIWDWIRRNSDEIYNRFGNSYNRKGNGVLRKISGKTLDDLNEIFRITGTTQRFSQFEEDAARYAEKIKLDIDPSAWNEYFRQVYENPNDIDEKQ